MNLLTPTRTSHKLCISQIAIQDNKESLEAVLPTHLGNETWLADPSFSTHPVLLLFKPQKASAVGTVTAPAAALTI